MSVTRGRIELNGEMVRTSRIVRYIKGVSCCRTWLSGIVLGKTPQGQPHIPLFITKVKDMWSKLTDHEISNSGLSPLVWLDRFYNRL